MTNEQELDVAILGAGFSGLCTAIRLREAGFDDFRLFESGGAVGGTWRDNTYPGCACDIPSHLYSLSFAGDYDWKRKYSEQPQIFDYLKQLVERFDLGERLSLNTAVTSARFDDRSLRWRVSTSTGASYSARVVISATGPFNQPSIPDLPGLEQFSGPSFHSARWRHDFDLSGKRVAVIGTGASAIQFVPRIAPQVSQLLLFQRTPAWVLPKPDRAFNPQELERFARRPLLRKLYRSLLYLQHDSGSVGFTMEPRLLEYFQRVGHEHIQRHIRDPELRAKLTPSYVMGCKRILLSNDYYPALARDNVEVISDGIASVNERGLVTRDGRQHDVDAIIFGTGFMMTDNLNAVPLHGKGGRSLAEVWQEGIEAFLGLAVSGFPNYFFLLGPNTGLGHNSVVFMAEAQVHYIVECLKYLRRQHLHALDVRPQAQRRFNRQLQARMQHTVWASGCRSWYLDEQGRNFSIWPGSTSEYWLKTRRFDPRAFYPLRASAAQRLSTLSLSR